MDARPLPPRQTHATILLSISVPPSHQALNLHPSLFPQPPSTAAFQPIDATVLVYPSILSVLSQEKDWARYKEDESRRTQQIAKPFKV